LSSGLEHPTHSTTKAARITNAGCLITDTFILQTPVF
jgi:hypothetical protein